MKRLLSRIAGLTGGLALSRRLTREVPRVFMLHRFSNSRQPGRTHVDDLVAFLKRVRSECEIETVSGAVKRLRDERLPSRPLAVITIDDGYQDFYNVALPVLSEMRIPATLYVTTGFVDRRHWLWWDALRYQLDVLAGQQIEFETSGRLWRLELATLAGRGAAWSELSDAMLRNNRIRKQVLVQLTAAGAPLPPELPSSLAPMTWHQLREAVGAGIEIGSHTITHPFLPGLSDRELRQEIQGAKDRLEHRVGCKIQTFAYPNGMAEDHSPKVERAVQATGHDSAVVAYPRRFGLTDPFRIGRWSASYGDPHLEHILSGASALKLAWSNS